MNRLLALFIVLLAVAAMSVPSLAMGSRGWISDPIPVVTVQPGGNYVRGPCLFTGTKSLSPCRPDLGVLPALVLLTPSAAAPLTAPVADIPRASLAREPALPPPRRA
jgi:hypothetical protein